MAGLSTPLTETLGIEYPIVQAPIGSLTRPELAAAVSNAGGLGTLAVTWHDLESTGEVIERTRELTDAPFAVNLVLDEAATIQPTDEHLEACLAAGAPLVSFSFGDPTPYVERCHDDGVGVLATVGDAGMAADVVAAGVDVVVAQGGEAGGHLQSDVATMPLVPRVADAVDDVPVIAAGGIADGRGVAGALALGADGAWLGTRFVASEEAGAHDSYKRNVTIASEVDTIRSQLFDGGWPGRDHRTLVNGTVREWLGAGRPPPGKRPGEGESVAAFPNGNALERYDDVPPMANMTGDPEALPQYAGQSAGLTGDVEPAADIVEGLVARAAERLELATAFVAD